MSNKSDLGKKISDTEKKIMILVDLIKKQIIMLKLLKQKANYLVLVVQLLILHKLQLKIKHLILVVQEKKTDYDTKASETEKRVTHHNPDKYVTTSDLII